MFQFLTGNLEYLGMRIDIAYNAVSSLSLWCFFIMLYSMAKRFFGSMSAGVLSVLFVVFRSGTAFSDLHMNIYRLVICGRLWPGILLLLDIPPMRTGDFGILMYI